MNKERVMKEYLTRVKKTCQSEFSSLDKVISHNTLIPVLTNTVGIIDWTIEMTKEMTGNLRNHPKWNVDKLYLPRSLRSRGIKMVA